MTLLSKAWHLVARFFTSLSSAPATDADEAWVDSQLLPGEQELWSQMGSQDRRHSALVARRFVAVRPEASAAEVRGAILHDVGKIECGLGTFGRVAATVVGSRGRRFAAYHNHEEIGADLAAAAGSDPQTVELIRGSGPAFEALRASDHA